jgi:hypothetical protein
MMKLNTSWEDFFYDGSHYISKNAYYRNSSFLIYPNWEEINRGILIPGDRWHPFCPSSMAPWDITLVYNKSSILFREIYSPLNALEKYHCLLDKELLLNNLQNNYTYIQDKYCIPVLDMTQFYEDNDFKIGDALLIQVLDYQKAIYKIQYIDYNEEKLMEKTSNSWLSLLDASLEKVINHFGEKLILPYQFDWAFFIGGPALTRHPKSSINHYLKDTTQFTISHKDGYLHLQKII